MPVLLPPYARQPLAHHHRGAFIARKKQAATFLRELTKALHCILRPLATRDRLHEGLLPDWLDMGAHERLAGLVGNLDGGLLSDWLDMGTHRQLCVVFKPQKRRTGARLPPGWPAGELDPAVQPAGRLGGPPEPGRRWQCGCLMSPLGVDPPSQSRSDHRKLPPVQTSG